MDMFYFYYGYELEKLGGYGCYCLSMKGLEMGTPLKAIFSGVLPVDKKDKLCLEYSKEGDTDFSFFETQVV